MTWDWREIKDIKEKKDTTNRELILPVALSDTSGVYYSYDFNEDQRRTVYRTNYNTGETDAVVKSNAYKIINLLTDSTNKLIGVRVLKEGKLQNTFLEMMSNAPAQGQNDGLEIVINSSLDNQRSVVYKEAHDQPGRYYVKLTGDAKLQHLGSMYPPLDNKLKSKLIESSVTVQDLQIPYLLSLPKSVKGPAPLIVMPHGGPISIFDNRYFDMTTQYLVANGFAVLRVNFRGSGGYSEALLEAGKKQFGGLILTDILKATNAVRQRSDIDSDRVCIAGLSYGGYAAAMLTTKHPGVYRCAVTIAGVSDVNLFLNSATITDAQIKWSKEHIGDSRKDYDGLLAISPIAHIQQLTRPILVMHGAKDTVVDVEHAFRLKLLLEKYNKAYEWHIFPEGEHNLNNPEETQLMFSKLVTFINKHLKN